jgi:hypothetical protein
MLPGLLGFGLEGCRDVQILYGLVNTVTSYNYREKPDNVNHGLSECPDSLHNRWRICQYKR